jgi:tetratricopeptide (TPR) repeat protein
VNDEDRAGGGPPRLQRVTGAPGASRGLAAPVVTAAAAIAANLAYEGPLASDGPLRLWYLAAAAQAAGRLHLDTDRGRFTLHFKRGVVEHASADAPDDHLGRFLVLRGVITPEALVDADRVSGDLGGDLVAALTQLGLMNPAESFRLLQEHGVAVVARALGAERGTASWTPGVPLPRSSFPLGSRWGLPCEAARQLDGLTVRKLLGERAHRIATRTGGRVDPAELRLTAQEVRAAALFDGTTSPAQLAARRPPDAENVLRVALLFAETELLAFGEAVAAPTPEAAPAAAVPLGSSAAGPDAARSRGAKPAAPQQPSRAPATGTGPLTPSVAAPEAARSRGAPTAPKAPAAPKPPAAAPSPKPAPQTQATLQAFYERVRTADHFDALGVKREATTAQIKLAYFALAKTYHPDAGPPGEPAAVKKLRADAFARLGEAWAVLGDDARRAAYVQEMASGGPANVDVSAIFKAEELFQKATVLVRSRQYDKALDALTQAIQLNAEEPEFGVWAAWVRFLLAQDRRVQHGESTAVMEAALKKVPRCIPAYLFLAQMAKIVGELDVAERHLKRGLALEPDQAELVRELKYLRK